MGLSGFWLRIPVPGTRRTLRSLVEFEPPFASQDLTAGSLGIDGTIEDDLSVAGKDDRATTEFGIGFEVVSLGLVSPPGAEFEQRGVFAENGRLDGSSREGADRGAYRGGVVDGLVLPRPSEATLQRLLGRIIHDRSAEAEAGLDIVGVCRRSGREDDRGGKKRPSEEGLYFHGVVLVGGGVLKVGLRPKLLFAEAMPGN